MIKLFICFVVCEGLLSPVLIKEFEHIDLSMCFRKSSEIQFGFFSVSEEEKTFRYTQTKHVCNIYTRTKHVCVLVHILLKLGWYMKWNTGWNICSCLLHEVTLRFWDKRPPTFHPPPLYCIALDGEILSSCQVQAKIWHLSTTLTEKSNHEWCYLRFILYILIRCCNKQHLFERKSTFLRICWILNGTEKMHKV